jgi:hypothetical protein
MCNGLTEIEETEWRVSSLFEYRGKFMGWESKRFHRKTGKGI